MFVYLPGLGLSYADRAGMSQGVEIRVPLLDLELVRWSFALPDHVLVKGRVGKWLLRQLAAQDVDPEVAGRAKRGFAVPTSRLGTDAREQGRRGFRQGAYFAHAAQLARKYLSQT
jgi:asparagine synthase (glutamine-hydrolysing)